MALVGPRVVMLAVVSVAAIVAVVWLNFWAFQPAKRGKGACALCRVVGACDANEAKDPKGFCCCPQTDGNGCFNGTFGCPPGYTCWSDQTLTGTCQPSGAQPAPGWSSATVCTTTSDASSCAATQPNDCCCVGRQVGQLNGTTCGTGPPGTQLKCAHLSATAFNLDPVPQGQCLLTSQPS